MKDETSNYIYKRIRIALNEQLRYACFDAGTLLLRHDQTGQRLIKWKDQVTRSCAEAIEDANNAKPIDSATSASQFIGRAFRSAEYFLSKLGNAVFDPDQHEQWHTMLNNSLRESQGMLAANLMPGAQAETPDDCLRGMRIEWENDCDVALGGYKFSNY